MDEINNCINVFIVDLGATYRVSPKIAIILGIIH